MRTGTASSAPSRPSVLIASARRQGARRRVERRSTSIAPTCLIAWSRFALSSFEAGPSRSIRIVAAIGRSSSLNRLILACNWSGSPVPVSSSSSSRSHSLRNSADRLPRNRSRKRCAKTATKISMLSASRTAATATASSQNHGSLAAVEATKSWASPICLETVLFEAERVTGQTPGNSRKATRVDLARL